MTLSELLGGQTPSLSAEEQLFIEHTKALWAKRFAGIIKETKGTKRGRV